jgi:glycosyltransferase involved in cell wall biosynthesis
MMDNSDVLLDQLYAYTPAMNALLAMSKGIVVVGGGEEENYEILHEDELRPIINVEPNYESVFQALEELVLHPEKMLQLKRQSVEYVAKHHDYVKVAKRYETLYQQLLP